MFKYLIFFLLAAPTTAFALVDMRNANFADPWVDLELSGTGYDLSVKRTYNSRTLYNGMFGFGWCSRFESKIETKSDGTLVLTTCGAGNETVFYPSNFKKTDVKNVVESIVENMKKSGQRFSAKYFNELSDQLYNDRKKREELAQKYNINASIKNGTVFKANLKGIDNIVYKDKQFVRTLSNSTTEVYDSNGKLVRKNDKNGNYLLFEYGKDSQISKIKDNKARQLSFTWTKSRKVKSIVGPKGLSATYSYDGQDLVKVTNAWKNTYTYQYDSLHNLTKISYPDNTTREIKYDTNKDWVVAFKHRDGCFEEYDYKQNKNNPDRHYTTALVKKCKGKVVTKSEYEFLFKPSETGQGDYLAKVRSEVNGRKTTIQYHPLHEKPVMVNENGLVTKYSYYQNGLVHKKTVGKLVTEFKYDPKCKKVNAVKVGKNNTQFSLYFYTPT